jgi:hypothetical protein
MEMHCSNRTMFNRVLYNQCFVEFRSSDLDNHHLDIGGGGGSGADGADSGTDEDPIEMEKLAKETLQKNNQVCLFKVQGRLLTDRILDRHDPEYQVILRNGS